MEQPTTHNTTANTVFWTAVISSWLTFPFFFSFPFGLLFWIGALVYLFIKRLLKKSDGFYLNYKNERLTLRSDNNDDLNLLEKTTKAKAFVYKNECLLVETRPDTVQRIIFLADSITGKVFACYYDYQRR